MLPVAPVLVVNFSKITKGLLLRELRSMSNLILSAKETVALPLSGHWETFSTKMVVVV